MARSSPTFWATLLPRIRFASRVPLRSRLLRRRARLDVLQQVRLYPPVQLPDSVRAGGVHRVLEVLRREPGAERDVTRRLLAADQHRDVLQDEILRRLQPRAGLEFQSQLLRRPLQVLELA